MIKIVKGPEPAGLKAKRDKAIADGVSEDQAYKRLKNPLKSQVRQSLVDDQGGLCAYCMCAIPRSDVDDTIEPIIIEHYIPRNPADGRSVGQALDYNNLLAVCHGNKGPSKTRKQEDLTCDAHRGNTEFKKVNPCDETTLETIYYDVNGNIFAGDADVNSDLIDVLNLNCPTSPIVGERKSALDTIIADIGKEDPENLTVYCADLLNLFENETNPKTPYVGIIIWYLKELLSALVSA